MKCNNCGALLDYDSKFCDMCGKIVEPESISKVPKKSRKKLFYGLGSIFISVVAVTLALILIFLPSANVYCFYIKDGQLYYADLDKNVTYQVTKRMSGNVFEAFMVLSKNGKRLFYLDDYVSESSTFSLFYIDVDDLGESPTRLDSGLKGGFLINEKGNRVTYLKDNSLYQHNLEDKTLISENVFNFSASADGKVVVFTDLASNVFFSDVKSCYKAVSNVNGNVYLSNDCKTFYYLEEDTLYKNSYGDDTVKISDEVKQFYGVYENGDAYYTKISDKEFLCADFIVDDISDIDNNYVQAEQKALWNRIRSQMNSTYFPINLYQLCKYNDKSGEEIVEDNVRNISFSSDAHPVFVLTVFDSEKFKQTASVKLSEFSKTYSAENKIYSKASECYNTAVVYNGDSRVLCEGSISIESLSENGKHLAYSIKSDMYSDLYRVSFDKKIGEPELVDNEVVELYVPTEIMNNGSVCYSKFDDSRQKCNLYVDGKLVSENVYNAVADSKSNTVYYYTKLNADNKIADLYSYKNSKNKIIEKDVTFQNVKKPEVLPGQGLIYYFDYLGDDGTVKFYNGKETNTIDEDVEVIVGYYTLEDLLSPVLYCKSAR